MAVDTVLDTCPYPLLALVGRGGQGDVYASRDGIGDVPLAVKVLRRDAGRRARGVLSREYQLLRELDHPAFPEAYGFGHLRDGRAWLAMQYLPGVAAHGWARAIGPAGSVERCLQVLRMLVGAPNASLAQTRCDASMW